MLLTSILNHAGSLADPGGVFHSHDFLNELRDRHELLHCGEVHMMLSRRRKSANRASVNHLRDGNVQARSARTVCCRLKARRSPFCLWTQARYRTRPAQKVVMPSERWKSSLRKINILHPSGELTPNK